MGALVSCVLGGGAVVSGRGRAGSTRAGAGAGIPSVQVLHSVHAVRSSALGGLDGEEGGIGAANVRPVRRGGMLPWGGGMPRRPAAAWYGPWGGAMEGWCSCSAAENVPGVRLLLYAACVPQTSLAFLRPSVFLHTAFTPFPSTPAVPQVPRTGPGSRPSAPPSICSAVCPLHEVPYPQQLTDKRARIVEALSSITDEVSMGCVCGRVCGGGAWVRR